VANVKYEKDVTALLVVVPYNDLSVSECLKTERIPLK